ncbi:ferredoxin:thioredoxin reductase [Methanosarcinaceae archaeon]|nr:ferredoxin:thioredoxin reductase [Methanosarcinaceae archaeon]MBQ3620553.1 ferredoxin:thioredoxin reductase [Methanosarcinaceae archaeon]
MTLEETKEKVLSYARKYADKNGYMLNPDPEGLDLVIEGLAKRREKYGPQYCPCRIVTGDKEEDRKIICPCIYHKQEIEEDGMCHCALYFRKDTAGKTE